MIILLTKDDVVSRIVHLVVDSLDMEYKIINTIDDINDCKILLIDQEFINTDIKPIEHLANSILYLVDDNTNNSSNRLKKPFLPSTLIKFINENIKKHHDTNIVKDEDEKYSNDICDEGIVDINSLNSIDSSLDQEEILSLKDTLIKDHGNNYKEESITQLDEIIDNVIEQLKDKDG
jgi:hypothetical protein